MHELSIAEGIVRLAEEQARSHRAQGIEEVELEIGRLAGVDVRMLTSALRSAVKGTMLEHARIVRRDIDGEGRCGDCGATFPLEQLFSPCPRCGSYGVSILRGRELRVKSIAVTDERTED